MTGSKYEPLGQHLASVRFNEWRATFADIEEVLGFRLPASAGIHAAWWGNDRQSHSQAASWLDIGWKATQVDVGAERVVFRRDAKPSSTSRNAEFGASEEPIVSIAKDPPSSLQVDPSNSQDPSPSTIWSKPSASTAVPDPQNEPERSRASRYAFGFQWEALGSVALSEDGRLVFPYQPAIPAVYRLDIRRGEHQRCYVGETDNLQRRLAHYRKPGPTQDTNIRLNAELLAALREGGQIAVSVVTGAWVNSGPGREIADLSSKIVRRIIENIALLDCASGSVESLNRELASHQLLPFAAERDAASSYSPSASFDVVPLSARYARKNLPVFCKLRSSSASR